MPMLKSPYFRLALPLFASLSCTPAFSQPIPAVPDPALDRCIQETAMANDWVDTDQFDVLECAARGIRYLDGLEMFSALRRIDVAHNPLMHVFPLLGPNLGELRELDLSYTTASVSADLETLLSVHQQLTHLSLAGIVYPDSLSAVTLPVTLTHLNLADTGLQDAYLVSKLSNLESLNLSENPLQDIESLTTLNQLKSLSLRDSGLTIWMPHWQWGTLEELDLANVPLQEWGSVSAALSAMPNLTSLSLANAPIDAAWLTAIPNPQLLRTLDLSRTHQSVVPWVSSLHQLESLKLDGIGVEDLWSLSGAFANLTELSLAENRLEFFDAGMLGVSGLQKLNLNGNGLYDLQISPAFASQLRELDLGGNAPLSSWSANNLLSNLTQIEKLSLANIALTQGEVDQIKQLPHLRVLDLSGSGLSDGFSLFDLPMLEELNLANNHLEFIDDAANAPNLRVLNLENNALHDFFISSEMSLLTELNLAGNQLMYLDIAGPETALRVLNLAGNSRLDPWQIQTLVDKSLLLKEINLSELPFDWMWIDRPERYDYLEKLVVKDTQLEYLHWNISSFQRLKHIDVSHNRIFDVMPLFSLPRLIHLDVSHNQVDMLWGTGNMGTLQYLDVSHNPVWGGVEPLFEFIAGQNQLQELHLDGLAIENFTLGTSNFPENLKVLSLADNQLQGAFDFGSWEQLKAINLSGNRLDAVFGVSGLQNLASLNLANNQFLYLEPLHPDALLNTLNISGNSGFDVASLLSMNLNSLQSLNVSGIDIASLQSLPMNQLENLQYLGVSDSGLTTLFGVDNLFQLNAIDFSENCLEDSLGLNQNPHLTHVIARSSCLQSVDWLNDPMRVERLVELDLRDNPFDHFVPYSAMMNLQKLSMTVNHEAQFNDLISLLQSEHRLDTLRIEKAPIQSLNELPTWTLGSLKELSLTHGQLELLDGIDILENVQSLRLDHNVIHHFPPVGDFSQLRVVSLLGNPLEYLGGLASAKFLESVAISASPMLPAEEVFSLVGQLSQLNSLTLDGVNMSALFDLPIVNQQGLTELSIQNSPIFDVAGLENFDHLKTLKIENAQLDYPLPLENLTQLRTVSFAGNEGTISLPMFIVQQLESLNLNHVSVDDSQWFLDELGFANNLSDLQLQGWSLSDMEFLSSNLQYSLESLNLADNQLTDSALLQIDFMENLTSLNLSGNNLVDVNFIMQMPRLTSLNLANNSLVDLTSLMSEANRLQYLNLSGMNNLLCYDLDALEVNVPTLELVRPENCQMGFAPDLVVMSPGAGSEFLANDVIHFSANGTDAEDGLLHHAIIWSSSIAGYLGMGPQLDVILPEGDHLITVSLQDSDGNRVEQTVTITVAPSVNEYCAATGVNTSYEWIEHIELNGQIRATGANGGYSDQTATPLFLQPGDQQLTLAAGYRYGAYVENWRVWIDWNHNGQFDASELMASVSGSHTMTTQFSLPANVVPGSTRMRIAMSWGSGAQPCGTFSWGEVEDYTVQF